MSSDFRLVQWNPFKVRYDLVLLTAVTAYIATFVVVGTFVLSPPRRISPPVLLIRALGTCAYLMLHVVLCIGPLARLDKRFLPLLYNRRHLGVSTFGAAALHGVLAVGFYHGFSDIPPLRSLFTSNTQYGSVSGFPFEILGLVALLILFLLAATSHDLWLKKLSAPVWKWLHMLVYLAWAAAVLHVALGALQSERSALYLIGVAAGVVTVGLLHLAAGRREVWRDIAAAPPAEWLDVGRPEDIPGGRAAVVCVRGGERVAVFRYGDRLSAVSNVCAHQGGPLGEGKIVDGCITCPWHGYQYKPADGQAPPPFTDRICTYRLRVSDGRILLDPAPLPPGTPVEPASIHSAGAGAPEEVIHA